MNRFLGFVSGFCFIFSAFVFSTPAHSAQTIDYWDYVSKPVVIHMADNSGSSDSSSSDSGDGISTGGEYIGSAPEVEEAAPRPSAKEYEY